MAADPPKPDPKVIASTDFTSFSASWKGPSAPRLLLRLQRLGGEQLGGLPAPPRPERRLSGRWVRAMLAHSGHSETMEQKTLDQLEAALDAVRDDLSPRVAELADKSTAGLLTADEQREYSEVVRLNDALSLLRLQAEEFRSMRAAS